MQEHTASVKEGTETRTQTGVKFPKPSSAKGRSGLTVLHGAAALPAPPGPQAARSRVLSTFGNPDFGKDFCPRKVYAKPLNTAATESRTQRSE